MGGDKEKCKYEQSECQICDKYGHNALQCPWVYSQCSKKNCNGLMKMLISEQPQTFGNKYLKCQYESCGTWKWFEVAISNLKGKKTEGSSSTTTTGDFQCFFQCGQSGHWAKNCPWKDCPCPHGCEEPKKLLTSRKERSNGQKFLKCVKCGSFEWLEDAMEKASKKNIRVKIEVNLHDLCKSFEKNINFPLKI